MLQVLVRKWIGVGGIKQKKHDIARSVDIGWLLVFMCQNGAFKWGIYVISLGFCGQICPMLPRFLSKQFLSRIVTFCFDRRACYQNSTMWCYLITNDKKLTSFTLTYDWLPLWVFTIKICQYSRQMSWFIKSRPLLLEQKIAKAVICLTKVKNQWSVAYFKVLIYNQRYQSVLMSLQYKQYCWNFCSTQKNKSIPV